MSGLFENWLKVFLGPMNTKLKRNNDVNFLEILITHKE